jgi:hypothetical protein
MSFNGNGVFLINSAGQPVTAGTVISSSTFNTLTTDLAGGLTNTITKDGQSTPTANIPMGNFRITGLGAAVLATDAVRFGQLQTGAVNLLTVTGTDTLIGNLVPALTAYTAGNAFYFVAAATNTSAMTINIDGLGVKDIRRLGSVALAAGDIVAGQIALIVYNGTNFQLLDGNAFSNLRVSDTLNLSAYTETVSAYSTVGASQTLSIAVGTVLTATLTSATPCTFTMPAAIAGKSFLFLLKQPASGTATTATFTGVKWGSAGAPVITAALGKMDILTFVSDGTNWYGSVAQGYTP